MACFLSTRLPLNMINCQNLAAQIQKIEPKTEVRDVARLCLLLCNAVDSLEELDDERRLTGAWREMSLRLQAATDQHAAMTEELEAWPGPTRTNSAKNRSGC